MIFSPHKAMESCCSHFCPWGGVRTTVDPVRGWLL